MIDADQNLPIAKPILDRSRLKLDLKPTNGKQLSKNSFSNDSLIVTPLSAPARSHYFFDHQSKSNQALISRRGLEAWKRALASAAPGTTMFCRNRDKSPIESLQKMWEERKLKDNDKTPSRTTATTPGRKSVSFLLLRKPASSIRRFYQKATSSSSSTNATSPWRIVNAAFTTTGTPSRITNPIEADETPNRIRTTQL